MDKIDDLECGVCMESYLDREPKILSCGHTYCMLCLQGLVRTNTISCAGCNTQTVLTSGVASLPTNYLVKSIAEQVKGKEKVKETQGIRCGEHNKTCKLFCEECKKPSCTVCAALYHRAHSCITIENSLQHYRKTLTDKTGAVKALVAKINNDERSIADSIRSLQSDRLRHEQAIRATMELMRASIAERERQLLSGLEAAFSQETTKLLNSQTELSSFSGSIATTIQNIERFAENLSIGAMSNPSTFDSMNSFITELDRITNTTPQTNNVITHDLIEFQNNGLETNIANTIQNIGKISVVRKAQPIRDYLHILPDGKQQPIKVFSSFTSNGQFLGKLEMPCDVAVIPAEWAWKYTPNPKNSQTSQSQPPARNYGDVFAVSEFASNRISFVEISSGNLIYTIGSISGAPSNNPGKLSQPTGLIVTQTGGPSPIKLVVADRGNNRIQIFDSENGRFLHQFAHEVHMIMPYGVAEIKQSGILVVSNLRTNCVTIHRGFGNNNSNNNNSSQSNDLSSVGWLLKVVNTNYSPHRVISNSKGHILVSNAVNIDVFDTYENGCKLLGVIGMKGFSTGQFQEVYGMCVDQEGNILCVDHKGHRVQIFRPDGSFMHCFGKLGKELGCFQNPVGITLTKDQRIFLVDHGNNRVLLF
eukprot:TRINITY_DN5130_c0_g2_i1.p1 TRINITY_DN5130_c0_g2~~TRINITY_DN5130_c0_g2_i1.p1  ORF type:complete len:646 (-),score=113.45 TRINITY_DN5130_c0_g2_i1:89-2026(-)